MRKKKKRKKKKKERKKERKKEKGKERGLWQNYNERQINTNARVKWKMAALIRQANNWNQMARRKGCWKWRRNIKEKEGWKKKPLLPPDRKPYMVTNGLWQRAMWQRLETRNPCTQYRPHNDANSRCTLNRRSRRTHIILFYLLIKLSRLARHLEVTPITPTSKKNETTHEAKGNAKRGKTNWFVGVYTKKLTDPDTKP